MTIERFIRLLRATISLRFNVIFGQNMNKKYKLAIPIFIVLLALMLVVVLLHGHTVAILDPQGVIARKQFNLILFALSLSLVVLIPVYAMAIGFAWKYRETNHHAKYSPDWDRSRLAETTWWAVPTVLIAILSVVTWNSSHDLDPFKPIPSKTKAMTIQVVALQWKWLFIYPEQNIATVNYVQFPQKTPVKFEITADAPMNAFWIPQLGGQIYAMSGMSTQLNLEAAHTGTYRGSSANISGTGFSGMTFQAKSTTDSEFKQWVNSVKQSPNYLSAEAYNQLARPSQNDQVKYYSAKERDLYNSVLEKYMPYQHHVADGQRQTGDTAL